MQFIVKLANPVAWETKATLKRVTVKKKYNFSEWPPVMRFFIHESNLSQSNLSCNKSGRGC